MRAAFYPILFVGGTRFRQLIAEGDSITQGLYPNAYVSSGDARPSVTLTNLAVAGSAMSDWLARAASVDTLIKSNRHGVNILTLMGVNDLGSGTSGADFAAAVSVYCLARKAYAASKNATLFIVLGTSTPHSDAGYNTRRGDFRTIVRGSGWAAAHGVDVIWDIGNDPIMGPDAAASDTNLYSDGVHATTLGQSYIELSYRKVINAVADVTAPRMTSAASANVDEKVTLGFTLTTDELDTAFALTGGVDQAQFAISGSTLTWVANGTQDYAAPHDSDVNNTYVAQVTPTDYAGNVGSPQTITVTVNQVVAFTPLALGAKLLIWYNANDAGSMTLVSGKVSQLNDKSGNGYHATQTVDVARVTYSATGLNSNPALVASGGTQYLSVPSLAPSGMTSAEVHWIAKMDGGQTFPGLGYDPVIMHWGTAFSEFDPYSNGLLYLAAFSTVRKDNIASPGDYRTAHIRGIRSAPGEWTHWYNAAQQFTTASNVVGLPSAPLLFTPGASQFVGALAQVIVVNGTLTTNERQKVEGYLAWNSGLQALLPGGHPYASAPP